MRYHYYLARVSEHDPHSYIRINYRGTQDILRNNTHLHNDVGIMGRYVRFPEKINNSVLRSAGKNKNIRMS